MKKSLFLTLALGISISLLANQEVDVKSYKVEYLTNVTDTAVIMDLTNNKEIIEVLQHPPRVKSINGKDVKYTMDKLSLQHLRKIYAQMESNKVPEDAFLKHVIVNENNEVVYFEIWRKDVNISPNHTELINTVCTSIKASDKLTEKNI